MAKRSLAETWREAVIRRAGPDRASPCLDAYDRGLAAGMSEAEAAYRALERAGLLWSADHLGDASPPTRSSEVPPA